MHTIIYLIWPADQASIDCTRLDFVYCEDFSISKAQTKMELIMANLVPKKAEDK